jgi:hypothetical protein
MRLIHLWFTLCATPLWGITLFALVSPQVGNAGWSLPWMIYVWSISLAALFITSIAVVRRRRAMGVFGFVTCIIGALLGSPSLVM